MKILSAFLFYVFLSLMQIIYALPQESIEKLEANVKQLKDWDYLNIIKFVDATNREQIQTDVAKIVSLVENKQFTEIDESFYNWFLQAFELLSKIKGYIDGGYVLNESTNVWEKTVTTTENKKGTEPTPEVQPALDGATIEKLENEVKFLREKNYENLLKYVDPADRERVTTDVGKIIALVDNKKFNEINEEAVKWFHKIVELLTTINQYIVDGYTYDEGTNTWTKTVTETKPTLSEKSVEEIENNVNELIDWNFEELIKNLEGTDKEEAEQVIPKVITLIKNKKYAEIDTDLKTKFNRIYKIVRESRPVSNRKIIRKINEFENVDWEKILKELGEIEGIDSGVWIRRIRKVIRQVKQQPHKRIEYPWLKKLRKVVRVIHREVRPLQPAQERNLYHRLRHIKGINWMRSLRRIRGINHNLWAGRIRKVLRHIKHHGHRKMNFPWLGSLRRIVHLIYTRTLPVHPIRPLRRVKPIRFVRYRQGYETRPREQFYKVRRFKPYRRIRPFEGSCHVCNRH